MTWPHDTERPASTRIFRSFALRLIASGAGNSINVGGLARRRTPKPDMGVAQIRVKLYRGGVDPSEHDKDGDGILRSNLDAFRARRFDTIVPATSRNAAQSVSARLPSSSNPIPLAKAPVTDAMASNSPANNHDTAATDTAATLPAWLTLACGLAVGGALALLGRRRERA